MAAQNKLSSSPFSIEHNVSFSNKKKKIIGIRATGENSRKMAAILNVRLQKILILYSIYSNSGHVFSRIKNPNNHFVQVTLKTIMPTFFEFCTAVSEEKIFESNQKQQKTSKKGNNSIFSPKFDQRYPRIWLNVTVLEIF